MSDKFKLTTEQLQEIEKMRAGNPVCRYLDMMENCKFSIGDILVKYTGYVDWDDPNERIEWELEMLNSNSAMPKRYVYVYEDKHGVGFIKRLNIRTGELGKETICLANTVGAYGQRVKYQVDPEYMDSVLLGDGSFDIKKLHKQSLEKKERIKELNKAAAFSSKKLSELNVFLSQLKPGATLYYLKHYQDEKFDFSGNWYQQIEIASITNPYISRLDEDTKGFYNDLELQKFFILDDKKVFKITEKYSWGHGDVITSLDLLGGVLWLNKPIELKDNIV